MLSKAEGLGPASEAVNIHVTLLTAEAGATFEPATTYNVAEILK
jgi:hypothetical protein